VGSGGDIYISQGNGAGDVALIIDCFSAAGSLVITQGNGNGDVASIVSSTIGSSGSGSASIAQGSGSDDYAAISGVYVSFGSLTITQADLSTNSSGDFADIDTSYAPNGNVSITQGNANGDWAQVIGVTAGYVYYAGPFSYTFNGNVTISQGNGYADEADLDGGNVVNNVYISQGDSIFTQGCLPGLGDEVDINDTFVDNDLSIVQGFTSADVGNNVVNIATTSAVFVGDATSINEVGSNNGNNTVTLGGANDPSGIDFQTDYLDIYTGAAGGGFVSAVNTDVWIGSALGNDYTIDGGGTGNTYDDLGNNYGVTISANFNYEFDV
jgi:hypothetical protein